MSPSRFASVVSTPGVGSLSNSSRCSSSSIRSGNFDEALPFVRFVLVVRTPSNETNVRFAGMRCEDREWKDFAFAGDDHIWKIDENAQWRRIQELEVINDLEARLAESPDFDAFLAAVDQAGRAHLGASCCQLLLSRDEQPVPGSTLRLVEFDCVMINRAVADAA